MDIDSGTNSEIAALCRAVAERLASGEVDLADAVRSELPAYRHVPLAEHRATLASMTAALLEDLAREGVFAFAETLQYTRNASRRRAHLGVPVHDTLRAFHIVNSRLWFLLRTAPEATDRALIALVEPLGRWNQAMTASVVDAYAGELPTSQFYRDENRRRFFELVGDATQTELVSELTRGLDFELTGDFQAIASPLALWDTGDLRALQGALDRLPGVAHCGFRDAVLLVLSQRSEPTAVLHAIEGIAGTERPLGVGIRRPQLTGARWSSVDAERALRVGEINGRHVTRFEDEWLTATLLDSEERLTVLFRGAHQVAEEHPDLAAAVRAFADHGFSLAHAAKALHLHPNSVAYRLSRWRELSGADPRTFSGLIRSVVGIDLGEPRGR